MNCPHCTSVSTKEQRKKTILGYRTFRCTVCKHLFNERTGTPAQLSRIPYGYRSPRRVLATARHPESAGSGGDVCGSAGLS